MEGSLEGVIVIDNDFRITYMNRYAREITGFHGTDAEGKFCYEVLRAKRCKDMCPIKALKAGKQPGEFIVDIIARDNSEKYIKAKVISTPGHWVEIFHDITREIELEKRIKGKYIFGDIITRDYSLLNILNQFPKIAESVVPVLLQGDSGVGKEVFASALQALSKRKEQPFIKINCASLPDTLLESELFGYKKGAFTDARKDKPGLFNAAHRGTLFLDEIGEMSMALQAKLLRAVETGEIIPLGASHAEKVDVRFLAATNKNLTKEIENGSFREDLFYRLNVVNINIPPLRKRKNDIPLFVDYFINQFNIIQEKNVSEISPEALEILLSYNFPGNIRELRNIMEYVFIFCNDQLILPQHIPEYVRLAEIKPVNSSPMEIDSSIFNESLYQSQLEEKKRVLDALTSARWNKKNAAAILNVDRSTLWRKMKKFGIK
ncbi:MAG: PAS domain-containing protein [bacterium]|nr:PAS domain-containing protein [bacterium]